MGDFDAGSLGTSTVPVLHILIALAILLTLGLITCVISHYKMGARSWSERRSRPPPQPPGAHAQFLQQLPTSPQAFSPNAYVLYSPDVIRERQKLEAAAQHDHQVRQKSVQTDIAFDLPATVSLPDGEDHAALGSSKSFHLSFEQDNEVCQRCIRPPPNRTIRNESSLPCRSNSLSFLHNPKSLNPGLRTSGDMSIVIRSNSVSMPQKNDIHCYRSGHTSPLLPHSTPQLHLSSPSVDFYNKTKSSSSSSTCSTTSSLQSHLLTSDCDNDPPPSYSDAIRGRNSCNIFSKKPSNGV